MDKSTRWQKYTSAELFRVILADIFMLRAHQRTASHGRSYWFYFRYCNHLHSRSLEVFREAFLFGGNNQRQAFRHKVAHQCIATRLATRFIAVIRPSWPQNHHCVLTIQPYKPHRFVGHLVKYHASRICTCFVLYVIFHISWLHNMDAYTVPQRWLIDSRIEGPWHYRAEGVSLVSSCICTLLPNKRRMRSLINNSSS